MARYWDCMSSVRPSVRLSVCDVGGSGSHRLEILETNYTDNKRNTFALRSPKAIHLLVGEHGEIWGRLEVGWGKVLCWSTKVAISLKHIKIEEKLLWRPIGTHQRSFERYHPRPPTASSSQIWGFAIPTQKSNRCYLRHGWSYEVQIWLGHSQCPSEQNH